jgi:type I restriction enzyme M protein
VANGDLNWITNFIWGIADDVLRDLYVRGKYRDVVLRRLDAVLEPTKAAVLEMKSRLDAAKIVDQDQALRQAAGQDFYNTSPFKLSDLKSRSSQQKLRDDFVAYPRRVLAERPRHPGEVRIPQPDPAAVEGRRARHADREVPLAGHQSQREPGLPFQWHGQAPGTRQSCHGHDVRGAGPPFQRREQRRGGRALDTARAVRLMAKLIFLPIADRIESGTYLIYDGACGTGGMPTWTATGSRSRR